VPKGLERRSFSTNKLGFSESIPLKEAKTSLAQQDEV
jgi:hypothetical protein